MAGNTSAPDSGAQPRLPLDLLPEVEEVLYPLEHLSALLSDFAGQSGRQFTDGIQLEHYAVVFGWIGNQVHDVRLQLQEVEQFLRGEK